jgi:hypothetical protein
MRFPPFLRSALFAFVALGSLALASGCKPSHDDAKQVKRVESQLNVPNPSEQDKALSDDRLEWNMETTVEAYEKVGSKNSKWNTYARDALKIFAQVRSYGPNIEGYPGVARTYAARAIELGCDDPLVMYMNARLSDWSRKSEEECADLFADAADRMENSQYPAVRKFYAATRAYNAVYRIKPLNKERAYTYLMRASQHLSTMLADRTTHFKEVDDACVEYLAIDKWGSKKERYDQVEIWLDRNWSKHGFSYLVQGQFYVDYAWDGRTAKVASKVTKEQWAMFSDRLKIAEERLLKGMEIDPREGRIPALMIKVVSGANKGLPEMKKWWDKAMEADPNSYDACETLLYFLTPRWYGSHEEMIAFGRECAASEKFGGTVPLILSEAHAMFNRMDGPKDGSYWKQPEVWTDIETSFEKFFRLNPKAVSWRHNYARYAYWCQQWRTLDEQLAIMGDNINYEYFGGEDKFNEMVKRTKEEVARL